VLGLSATEKNVLDPVYKEHPVRGRHISE